MLADLHELGIRFSDLHTEQSSLEEMQSIVSPVISTSLYFVVFGAAIGSRITEVEGVSYGSFIVPGLIILATASLFVPIELQHPGWMLAFLVLTAVAFSRLGFIIGICGRRRACSIRSSISSAACVGASTGSRT